MQASLRELLVAHARRYPLWGLDDLYKLLHQAALGSEHASTSETEARRRLLRELAELGPGPEEPLVDPISPDGSIARVHLRPFARMGLDAGMLLAAFLRTAQESRGSSELIEFGLTEAARLAGEGALGFSEADIRRLEAEARGADFPAVHHTAGFVAAYRPAYRVVARAFLRVDSR